VVAEPQLAIWLVQTVPGQPVLLSRMHPASRRGITRKSGLSSTPQHPGSINAIRKGFFTTFAGKNVIPLTWHSTLSRGCHSRAAFDLCG